MKSIFLVSFLFCALIGSGSVRADDSVDILQKKFYPFESVSNNNGFESNQCEVSGRAMRSDLEAVGISPDTLLGGLTKEGTMFLSLECHGRRIVAKTNNGIYQTLFSIFSVRKQNYRMTASTWPSWYSEAKGVPDLFYLMVWEKEKGGVYTHPMVRYNTYEVIFSMPIEKLAHHPDIYCPETSSIISMDGKFVPIMLPVGHKEIFPGVTGGAALSALIQIMMSPSGSTRGDAYLKGFDYHQSYVVLFPSVDSCNSCRREENEGEE